VFNLFRNRRRRRLLVRESISDSLWSEVVNDLPALSRLGPQAMLRLRELALLFIHEKRIEPAHGFETNESMRVRIAALACLPVLELGLDCYDGVRTIVVHPDEFVVSDREHMDDAGVVHSGDDVLSGEAWEQGPIVLAWKDIEASGRGEGYNVVVHEFAHKLDLLSGEMDGFPPLHRGMSAVDWRDAFQAGYDDLLARLDRGEDTLLDAYWAEDPAEFFAVCAEVFFDVPDAFRAEYPALYRQLRLFFKQDTASS
jgi:Mlc titration factor MtfA (ptsG expression regulator)